MSRIVRLTVETNLLTSRRILNSGTLPGPTALFPAAVAIVALVLIVVKPVRDLAGRVL